MIMKYLGIFLFLVIGLLWGAETEEESVAGEIDSLIQSVEEIVEEEIEKAPEQIEEPEILAGTRKVYVVPVQEEIGEPNLYILRFALKKAIADEIDVLVLDMNTPGGRLDVTLEMMEMLDKFEGQTMTYINPDAISAGAYISAATEEIFFAPKATIGAAAVIQGTGEDVNETLKLKIDSYLKAKVRSLSEEKRYRADVIRAMMDEEFELKIGEEVLKESGELLTLTATEAMKEYGDPAEPLLGSGIYSSIDELLADQFGADRYEIKEFQFNWAQSLAIFLKGLAPMLIGIGLLGLFVEFKTPGFGIFGIGGITCLLIVFASNYVAGLAGTEPILFFILGVILLGLELFVFPGIFIAGVLGIALMLGSLLWSLADIWPKETDSLNLMIFLGPIGQVFLGLMIAAVGMLILSRILPKSWIWNKLVLAEISGGEVREVTRETIGGDQAELLGQIGVALTALLPSGRVEVAGKTYDATAQLGSISKGDSVKVVGAKGFSLNVEKANL